MLLFLDVLFTLVHLTIIGFNLFGWIPKAARKAHFISIVLTAASWFVLGLWYGIGYCPITDWQWDVKRQLGETGLPNNFIEYMAEQITGRNFSETFVNTMIGVGFAAAAALSVYVNFILTRQKGS